MTDKEYEEITNSIQSGSIHTASQEKLSEYLARLCKHSGHTNASHIITGIAIFNEQNRRTQKWVIRLAWAAIIFGAIQTSAAILAYKKTASQEQQIETTQQSPTTKEVAAASQKENPASHQAIPKIDGIVKEPALKNVSSPNPPMQPTANGGG